jgi:carboxyl-terminal processing protease
VLFRSTITSNWESKIKQSSINSDKRIKENSLFQEIEVFAQKIEKLNSKTRFTLNLTEYREDIKQSEADNKKYEEIMKGIQTLKISNTSKDDKEMSDDETKRKVKADWNKSFEKDIYIQEAVNVLKDLN